jgi:hypothetical protein
MSARIPSFLWEQVPKERKEVVGMENILESRTIEEELKEHYRSVLEFPEAQCNTIEGVSQAQHLARLAMCIAQAREMDIELRKSVPTKVK